MSCGSSRHLPLSVSMKIFSKKGKIDFVDGSDQLVAELSKNSSDYDIIVAPINLGAKLIASEQTDYRIQGVITWGNLYYIGTSNEALNQTGELGLFGEGAVPQKIVDTVKINTSLTPKYYQSATLVQQQLLSGNIQVGMLAEPLAVQRLLKLNKQELNFQLLLIYKKNTVKMVILRPLSLLKKITAMMNYLKQSISSLIMITMD